MVFNLLFFAALALAGVWWAYPLLWLVPLLTWMMVITRIRNIAEQDRKSTRLNSSHLGISYAVFCLKKKKKNKYTVAMSESVNVRHNRWQQVLTHYVEHELCA